MIDHKGWLFGKISVVDLMVVVLVLGIALGTVYKLRSPATNVSTGNLELRYTVRISDVRSFSAEYYHPGLRVYDSKTDAYIGLLESVEVNPFLDDVTKEDGSIVKAEVPGKIEILLSLLTEGLETEQSFLAGGTYELKVGSGIYMKTKYVDVVGVVDSVASTQ